MVGIDEIWGRIAETTKKVLGTDIIKVGKYVTYSQFCVSVKCFLRRDLEKLNCQPLQKDVIKVGDWGKVTADISNEHCTGAQAASGTI